MTAMSGQIRFRPLLIPMRPVTKNLFIFGLGYSARRFRFK